MTTHSITYIIACIDLNAWRRYFVGERFARESLERGNKLMKKLNKRIEHQMGILALQSAPMNPCHGTCSCTCNCSCGVCDCGGGGAIAQAGGSNGLSNGVNSGGTTGAGNGAGQSLSSIVW